MIAHVCGLKAGEFVHTIGDAHIYKNHVVPLKEQASSSFSSRLRSIFTNISTLYFVYQISRTPRPFPTLNIKQTRTEIDHFEFGDFEVVGYNPYPTIKMEMSVWRRKFCIMIL